MVIVARYLDNAVSEVDDFVSGKGNRLFTKLINFFYDGNYTDT